MKRIRLDFDNSILKNEILLEEVFNEIKIILEKEKFVQSEFILSNEEVKIYKWIKSYRSNVTEGNTTTDGEFTKIVKNDIEQKSERITRKFDDQKELENLNNVYKRAFNIDYESIIRVNYDLGKDVLHNDFLQYRGKIRKVSVYIPFTYKDINYDIYFINSSEITNSIKELLNFNSRYNEESIYDIIAKAIIFHNELIGIHPFRDGNGRTTRVFWEKIMEDNNIFPFIPLSSSKKEYQDAMGQFIVEKESDVVLAYVNFTKYFILNYSYLVEDVKESLDQLIKKL